MSVVKATLLSLMHCSGRVLCYAKSLPSALMGSATSQPFLCLLVWLVFLTGAVCKIIHFSPQGSSLGKQGDAALTHGINTKHLGRHHDHHPLPLSLSSLSPS